MQKIYNSAYAINAGKSLKNLINAREAYIMALVDFNQTGFLDLGSEIKILEDDALQAVQED